MKCIIAIIYLVTAVASNADSLSFSVIAEKLDAESRRMTLKNDGGKRVFFVKHKAILNEANIAKIWLDPKRKGNLWVQLDDAGFDELVRSTVKMRDGVDRLAVIVDGRLISILTVNGPPLGRYFVISELDNFELHEADDISQKFSGLPTHAIIRPPLPDVRQ